MKKFFNYNQSTHEATATLIQKGIKVTGRAKAHEDDLRYANQFTGIQIAEFRAIIKLLEKRSRRKLDKAKVLRNDAEFLENSANEDLAEVQELRGMMAAYIMEKDTLYKNLTNPPERIKWNDLDENMLSDSFKESMNDKVVEGEIEDGKTEN